MAILYVLSSTLKLRSLSSIQYFFPELDRLFQSDYVPSLQDILHARGKTTGITETIFENKSFSYRLFDVGVSYSLLNGCDQREEANTLLPGTTIGCEHSSFVCRIHED